MRTKAYAAMGGFRSTQVTAQHWCQGLRIGKRGLRVCNPTRSIAVVAVSGHGVVGWPRVSVEAGSGARLPGRDTTGAHRASDGLPVVACMSPHGGLGSKVSAHMS